MNTILISDMAEGKKSFIMYSDYIHTVDLLSDEQAGKLMKHLFQYVNDMNPECEDPMVNIAFASIKARLKNDLNKWEDKREKRSEAGKLGGIKSGESRRKKQTEANEASASITKQNEANEAVNVNVNGNVNVNVNKSNRFAQVRDWYYKELEASGHEKKYKQLVDVLFGDNELNEPLTNVLKLPSQVSFSQMPAIIKAKNETSVSVHDVLMDMNNKPKAIKDNSSVQRTIISWMKIRRK